MKNVVCWPPNQVFGVLNPEAESIPDYVFRAVHSEQTLKVAQPVGDKFQNLSQGGQGAFVPMSERELLEEFLRPERRHVQLAVFGRSGSGKSHLIHWLRLAMPTSEQRMVVTIPKAGTSLRSVVESIIERLPVENQRVFRGALAMAGDATLTVEGQKHELLNQIAQAIREDVPRLTGEDAELEQALIETLPNLFQDAHIRMRHFLSDEGIVASLVEHVFAIRSEYNPLDERQQFRADDLPTGGGLDLKDASKPARDAIQVLMIKPERSIPLAVAIVNRALDGSAIARAFGFSGDRVTALMTELRRYLKGAGRELVLLIEDFAQLQGIDRALLQALLTQGSDDICDIRWAIAATTGFFETVADTVYTRMTFFVDMDRSLGDSRGRLTEKTLARFAGRYLNAVRVGETKLAEWSITNPESDTPPNACDPCPYRETCHAAFKVSEDGFGLYPFTPRALMNMAGRADQNLDTGFNPRTFQRSVLVRVLDTYVGSLKVGAFPPRALLEELGGIKELDVVEQAKLRESVGSNQFDRAIAFQELWQGYTTTRRPRAEIAEAFSLPSLDGSAQEDETEEQAPEDTAPEDTRKSIRVDPRLADLDAWAAGGRLKQNLANDLRKLIYDAIERAIDWDDEHLVRSTFAGATQTRPFRQRSLAFRNQETNFAQPAVKLTIPIDSSDSALGKAALAFRGLILAEGKDGNWTFPNGTRMLMALQDCLADWTAEVVRQIQSLPGSTETWNPTSAAAELLGVGACLAGSVRPDSDLVELLNSALGVWPDEGGAQAPALQQVYKRLLSHRETLVSLVRAINSGTKGGQAGGFLDPGAVVPALASVRREGRVHSRVYFEPTRSVAYALAV